MNNTLVIPDGWHEVTISQFQEINSLNSKGIARTIDVISILTNEDPELIKKLNSVTLAKLIDNLQWTNSTQMDNSYKTILKVNDKEYGLIGKLSDLTTGEWIDLETYLENPIDNLHIIFSILYRPIIAVFSDRDRIVEEYDARSKDARAELFRDNIMISDVYGALVFFSIIARECMMTIVDYLEEDHQVVTKTNQNLEKLKKNVKNV